MLTSGLPLKADIRRSGWIVRRVPNAEIKDEVIGFNLSNLDQRHTREAPLYGRHDDLLAEEQFAHTRPGLLLTDDVIGHRDKVTAAAIEG
jgi:hypothetical protein